MGLFSGINNTWKKSEAAVVVQKLLEHQVMAGWLVSDPAALANKLVSEVWDQKPHIFNGKFGQRAHKITVAASALANGLHSFSYDDPNGCAFLFSLGNILSELEVNGELYPFNSLDFKLLEDAASVFAELGERVMSASGEHTPGEDREPDLDLVEPGRSLSHADAACENAVRERSQERLKALVHEYGLRVADESDNTHVAAAVAAHVTRTAIIRCGWNPKDLSKERKFAATVVSIIATDRCSRLAGAEFEITCPITALELFWPVDPSELGSLLREATEKYNRMMAGQPEDHELIRRVGNGIAEWIGERNEIGLHRLTGFLKGMVSTPITSRSADQSAGNAHIDPDSKPPISAEGPPLIAQQAARERRRTPARAAAVFAFAILIVFSTVVTLRLAVPAHGQLEQSTSVNEADVAFSTYVRISPGDGGSAEISITPVGANRYYVTGLALWGEYRRDTHPVHMGELDFTAELNGDALEHSEPYGDRIYRVVLRFTGNMLQVTEENWSGVHGMNVTFESRARA